MLDTKVKKKTNYCKRNKKNWRKYISTKDVDDFLDSQRLEERLGGPAEKRKDEQLFHIDIAGKGENAQTQQLTKKERAMLPDRCLSNLKSLTAVPDPIVKRNRVKTKEERKSVIRKSIEKYKESRGIVKKKILEANIQRRKTLLKKKLEPKTVVFKKNIWEEKNTETVENWLQTDTEKHLLLNKNVKPPALKTDSIIPAIEPPHPGTSYNPSFKDHKNLIDLVIMRETEELKKEAHLKRVTSGYRKATPAQLEKEWKEEMMQGLVKDESEVKEEETDDIKPINLPVSRKNQKTRKQKRRKKELRDDATARKAAKVEKKKESDIYKLRFIEEEIVEKEDKAKYIQDKRDELAEINKGKTKRLAAKKFENPDIVFSRSCELRSNLRSLNKQGSILSDRFYSLQKRNILAPSTKQIGPKKAKVKVFTKKSHKIDGVKI